MESGANPRAKRSQVAAVAFLQLRLNWPWERPYMHTRSSILAMMIDRRSPLALRSDQQNCYRNTSY
jgi:hypothetical protein